MKVSHKPADCLNKLFLSLLSSAQCFHFETTCFNQVAQSEIVTYIFLLYSTVSYIIMSRRGTSSQYSVAGFDPNWFTLSFSNIISDLVKLSLALTVCFITLTRCDYMMSRKSLVSQWAGMHRCGLASTLWSLSLSVQLGANCHSAISTENSGHSSLKITKLTAILKQHQAIIIWNNFRQKIHLKHTYNSFFVPLCSWCLQFVNNFLHISNNNILYGQNYALHWSKIHRLFNRVPSNMSL